MEKCENCNQLFQQTDKLIRCDFCEKNFHISCENIDAKMVQSITSMKQKTGIIWFCSSCKKMEPLKLIRCIPLLMERQAKLEHAIDNLKQPNKDEIAVPAEKVEVPILSQDDIIDEIELRKKNEEKLVISGLDSEKGKEKEITIEFLKNRVNLDVTNEIRSVYSLKKPGKAQMTFLHLKSRDMQNEILKADRKLKKTMESHIYINPAYTKLQLKSLFKLRAEAKAKSIDGKVFYVRNFQVLEFKKKTV